MTCFIHQKTITYEFNKRIRIFSEEIHVLSLSMLTPKYSLLPSSLRLYLFSKRMGSHERLQGLWSQFQDLKYHDWGSYSGFYQSNLIICAYLEQRALPTSEMWLVSFIPLPFESCLVQWGYSLLNIFNIYFPVLLWMRQNFKCSVLKLVLEHISTCTHPYIKFLSLGMSPT